MAFVMRKDKARDRVKATVPVRLDDALVHYRRAAEIDPGTLIGERSQTQLDTLHGGTPAPAGSTPAVATP